MTEVCSRYNISKPRLVLALVALCLSTMCTMGDFVVVPITATFYELYPEMIANLISTGPSLIGIPFCWLGGKMADKMDKKIQMVLGFGLFALSGIFGVAVDNSIYIVVMRCICTGVAWGLTCTGAGAIIADFFIDTTKRATIMGYYNLTMTLCGSMLSMMAGNLATAFGWKAAFNAYYISVPVLILLIVCLPSMKPTNTAPKLEEKKDVSKAPKSGMKDVVILSVLFFFSAITGYILAYMFALYVAETGIGDAAFIGNLSSVCSILGLVVNFFFGKIYGKLKDRTAYPSVIIMVIIYLVLAWFPNKGVTIAVRLIQTAGWGLLYSFFFTQITVVVPAETRGTALGWINVANGLAAFAVSYYLTFLKAIFKTDSLVAVFPVVSAVMAVTAVCFIIYGEKVRKERLAKA